MWGGNKKKSLNSKHMWGGENEIKKAFFWLIYFEIHSQTMYGGNKKNQNSKKREYFFISLKCMVGGEKKVSQKWSSGILSILFFSTFWKMTHVGVRNPTY